MLVSLISACNKPSQPVELPKNKVDTLDSANSLKTLEFQSETSTTGQKNASQSDTVTVSDSQLTELTATIKCIKCDVGSLVQIEKKLSYVSAEEIDILFCIYDDGCNDNAEFAEIFNPLLFELLSKHAKHFINALAKKSTSYRDEIYSELANPLLSHDYEIIRKTVQAADGNNDIKKEIMISLDSAKTR